MLRQKLERSEKSRSELRQNADLLESKVPFPSCVGSLNGVRCVDRGGDDVLYKPPQNNPVGACCPHPHFAEEE